ncbi:MAG: GntR family transcriptional regulator [Chloroflexi bacterium]|nr:GntR family transcriptional regulator [Chloroflexota bacterium]
MAATYRTMQEIVTDSIRDAILSGKYSPGERLIADDLAKDLGVSRMPVREALHRLQVAGLVTMLPHKGAVVTELSQEEIIESYHIRAVLDGLAARLAAPHLAPSDYARLKEILQEMEKAVDAKDVDSVLVLNRAFHEVIWQAAHAPHLQSLLQNLYDASERFRNISIILPGRLEQFTQDHRQIVQMLEMGDVVKAERYANEHHESTARRLLNSIEKASDKIPTSTDK